MTESYQTEPYQKDMSHLNWAEVYSRQEKRAALVAEWLDVLALQPGERVLDVGSGPGYVSLQAARRVGPTGLVYAVDRSAEALAYLEGLQQAEGLSWIVRVVADAATLDPPAEPVDVALVTMVLHHTDDPAGVLRSVARCLRPGARVVVAEFHPDGPGEYGPPSGERISPETVRTWCEEAGLSHLVYRRQSPEHYAVFAERD
jgi:ubiquinone/menaquinone biosynthesis C-methylase UbiE